MPLSHHALDTFVSQHLSKLGTSNIASAEADFPERASWFNSYVLNRIFNNHVPDEKAALAFVLLRRADAAFDEWESACQTLALLASKKTISGYFKALRHLEACVAAAEQWYASARKAMGLKSFAPGDGSAQERLNFIYNQSRHLDPGALEPCDLHRVWIANDGLHVKEKAVLFWELRDMLIQIGRVAAQISGGKDVAAA